MTTFAVDPQELKNTVATALGDLAQSVSLSLGQVTVVVQSANYLAAAQMLRDDTRLQFEILLDLCGVDYSQYRAESEDGITQGARFCVVTHLLSVSLNQRVRLKVFAANDEIPMVPSLCDLWASVNWFEREAFDLYGVVFGGHNDLRRILTDYGFIGHPFRKDFPTTGYVEMRYDADQKRVVYQPVSIEPREITPRIIREDRYGSLGGQQ